MGQGGDAKQLAAPHIPCVIVPGPRKSVRWGGKELLAEEADEGFYRISGVKGSGKTHVTKDFVLQAARELQSNPHAKLIVYEPKREFFAWLSSLGLSTPIHYLMTSDKRSVSLDFTTDYPSDVDSMALAYAFHPAKLNETQQFWGDSLRTIYSSVMTAIKHRVGYFDLRLVCAIMENEKHVVELLGHDPYLKQAMKLVKEHGQAAAGGDTKENIQMTIHSRIAEMKVLAAQLDQARTRRFSLRRFIEEPNMGTLVLSKDSTYGVIQDPLNGVTINRIVQILDAQQEDKRRKVFIVIDEFPTLAGDAPCPGIHDMFLRLRSRGVTVLIAYQAYSTLKRIYGEQASEILGQCTNIMYLRQPDVDSAKYAADDLGWERGYERTPPSTSTSDGQFSYTMSHAAYDRPIFPHSALTDLPPARAWSGVHGIVKTAERPKSGEPVKLAGVDYPEDFHRPKRFDYPPDFVDRMPKRDARIPEYLPVDPKFEPDEPKKPYFDAIKKTQRVKPLSHKDKLALGLSSTPPPPPT